MKSIKTDFKKFMNFEGSTTYTAFSEAIKNKNFTREIILRNFNKFVDKDEYSKKEKKSLIDHLYSVSKPCFETEIKQENEI